MDVMPEQSTITAQYYTDLFLPQVLEDQAKSARTRRWSRFLLRHDNAVPYKTRFTVQFLVQQGITTFPPPNLIT